MPLKNKYVHVRLIGLAILLAGVLALTACGGGSDTPAVPAGSSSMVGRDSNLLAGAGAPAASMGFDGSYYLDTASGRLFGPKVSDAWPPASLQLAGSAGPAGPAGANGVAGLATPGLYSGATAPSAGFGEDGDFYLNTTDRSIIGPKANGAWPASGTSLVGPAGPAVTNGINGTNATSGAAGSSLLSGSGQPSNTVGGEGDYHINTLNSSLIGPKAAGAWPVFGVSLVGLTGATGANSGTGPAGTNVLAGAGAPGAGLGTVGDLYFDTTSRTLIGPKTGTGWPAVGTALNGTNGRTILSAAVDPTGGDGVTGDFFINTASSKLFGPKAAGGWLVGVSLVGSDGTNGPSGANGAAGTNGKAILNGTGNPNGVDGSDGDFFINTATNTLFGPKTGSTWPAGVSLVGPAGGVVAPEILACTSGATTVVTPASSATRTLFCNFNGGNISANFTQVNLVLPAAATYISGTVITFRTTGLTFYGGALSPLGLPQKFFFQSAGSTYTGYSAIQSSNRNDVSTATAIELVNGEGALFSVMAVGTRWFQLSP